MPVDRTPSGTDAVAEALRVGFQGALGAFSEEAVRALVPDADPVPLQTFEAVVRAVEGGEVEAGVLAVENTLAGAVAEAYEALVGGDVTAVAEMVIPIRHCLLGLPGSAVEQVREARSHPVALSQCRGFFADHPKIRAQAVYDTAGAAEEVAALGDPSLAAIASARAGERYGLEILMADLQDRDDNQTRFYLIVPRGERATAEGLLKTACIVELEHRPGALHQLLGVFAERGLDLTNLASRPGITPWTYRFILEFRHSTPEEGVAAIEAASALCSSVRVLGTFPAWRPETAPS